MTPSVGPLGGGKLIAWRLDQARFASIWDSGEGAFQVGGRWNSKGVRVVYCALDPATAILEVAVHKGFKALDTLPHVLTALHIVDVSDVHIVRPVDVPNANWLRPGIPGAGQQTFGDVLLAKHKFVVIPSVVSNHSWNLIFDPTRAKGAYQQHLQEAFALDTRLHPSTSPP
ncbi:RES family NAD+ phosphorylase [Bradyrhizobium uaiense]|uniref:RES domain-containing protein n=1 Tax=Bradyrhizobium uaiense TaxID=2594946 RepID=A0A6P1BIL8_9BRAD|nr:RES domain-containing protein [Bradyrhizobium uaiense]NEU98004.1 RES domain-containing protein [Bradyrhizobium uaiense]